MEEVVAITVHKISKDFKLPHQKINSVKGFFTNVFALGNRSFETQHALQDISFEVKKGEFFGIVGRNGSGKSTLLKILAEIYQPTHGQIAVRGKLVPFIELGVGFNPELTGRENVYLNGAMLGFSTSEIDDRYEDIVAFAELENFMDQKLKNYSSGMQVRLAFSVATRAEADILLVDEVLAVGDAAFQKKCFDYFRDLKRQKKTVVFISHDMNAIEQFCDRAMLINDSKLELEGTPGKVARAYRRMFTEKAVDQRNDFNESQANRWGDAKIKYDDVKVVKEEHKIKIIANATAFEDVEYVNFGFNVKNFSDATLFGTSSVLQGNIIEKLGKGQKVHLEWEFDNLFNEGTYSIDVAVSYDRANTADWWERAQHFKISRDKNNPFYIFPIITDKIEVT